LNKQPQTDVTIKDLIDCGAHFGHQRQRWNPKMKRYIFEERGGIYIIDLAKTVKQIRKCIEVVEAAVENHQSILFIGTKKQAKSVVKECAESCGEFYVCERWLGGMLTNLSTIRKSVKTLERVEKRVASGVAEGLKKKEISVLSKQQQKLDSNLAGIRSMRKTPGLVVIVDPSKEHIAVAEAKKLGIPVMAVVDTNCDPEDIDYVIPANDDALKSIKLILQSLAAAIMSKKSALNIAFRQEETEAPQAEEKNEEGEANE